MNVDNLISSVGPAATQGLFGFLNQGSNKAAQNRQNRSNMAMAEYQYSKELEMWNRQNQYNSPQMQMQRFRDAGLNPNLIYGQGTPGNATQMPKYQAPQLDKSSIPLMTPEMIGGMLNTFMDVKVKNAQVNNLNNTSLLNSLRALDQEAKNWFNFRGITNWTGGFYKYSKDDLGKYDSEYKIAKYQKDVLQATIDAQVKRIMADSTSAGYESELKKFERQYGRSVGAKYGPIYETAKRNWINMIDKIFPGYKN